MSDDSMSSGIGPYPRQPLSDLPPEIVNQILSNLSPSDLAIVAITSSQMQARAEPFLWGELWLQQPQSLDLPPPQPPGVPITSALQSRRDVFRRAAKDRTLEIMMAGCRKPLRWRHVHTINATAYRFSTHHIATILHLVHRNLVRLNLHCAQWNLEWTRWGPHDGMLSKLGDLVYPFPMLVHLDFTACRNESYEQIERFIALAPNVERLRVTARDPILNIDIRDPPDDPWLGLPEFLNLHTLEFNFEDEDGLPWMCRNVLAKAPNLRKVLLADLWASLAEDGWSDEEEGADEDQFDYFTILAGLSQLEYLDWRCGSYEMFTRSIKPEGTFSSLRTVVVDGGILEERMERLDLLTIPLLPNLETLVYRTRHPTRAHELATHDIDDDASMTHPISAATRQDITKPSQLVRIMFCHDDDLDLAMETKGSADWLKVGVRGAIVSSYILGDNELLHIRTLTRSRRRPAADIPSPVESTMGDASDSSMEADMYELGEKLRWEHAVAFNGKPVTAEVMDRAFEREEAGWRVRKEGKGQSLPERVWTVLEFWQAREMPVRRSTLDEIALRTDLLLGLEPRPDNWRRHETY